MNWIDNADGTSDLTVDVSGLELPDMGAYLAEYVRGLDKRKVWLQVAILLTTEDRRTRADLRERYEPDRFRSLVGEGNKKYLTIAGALYPWARRGTALERAFGPDGMYERAEGSKEKKVEIVRAIVQVTYAKGKPNRRM